MSNAPQYPILSETFKTQVYTVCKQVYDEIIQENGRITTIVIQFKNGDVTIGKSGSYYRPIYYDAPHQVFITPVIKSIGDANAHIFISLFDQIKIDYPTKKYKSFNVHFNGKTNCVSVCENRIGNTRMGCCGLYMPFTNPVILG